jgi:hypothetical protein
MTREERETELLEMTWQAVKAIAEPLGISKPAGGWDETIPLILDFEFPDIEEVEEVDQDAAEEAVESQPETETSTIFSTDYFEKSGIPYCKTCGASYQNDLSGMPICPVSNADCDRLR